jgi:hypothetical protein
MAAHVLPAADRSAIERGHAHVGAQPQHQARRQPRVSRVDRHARGHRAPGIIAAEAGVGWASVRFSRVWGSSVDRGVVSACVDRRIATAGINRGVVSPCVTASIDRTCVEGPSATVDVASIFSARVG